MMKTNFRRQSRAGFTVIELMMVVLIIAILIALVVSLSAIGGRRTDHARGVRDMEKIKVWLEEQRVDSGRYPDTIAGYSGEKNDPWGRPYIYEVESTKKLTFKLWSNGPDGAANTGDELDLSAGQM
jgi:general secretion pathway protein G